MNPGIVIPLAVFGLVIVIVALTQTTKTHDLETETHYRLREEEFTHRTKMEELERELHRIRQETHKLSAPPQPRQP
jgi:hypothetical protein